MKFGIRKPSLNKSIAARTSPSRYIRHNLGFKAPRGMGWITNPRKAAYNRAYNRNTFSLGKGGGLEALVISVVIFAAIGIFILLFQAICWIVEQVYKAIISKSSTPETDKHPNAEPEQSSNANLSNVVPLVSNQRGECPACPRCNLPMVLRTAKRGRNSGNQFWGCSTFPTCRGTRTKAA